MFRISVKTVHLTPGQRGDNIYQQVRILFVKIFKAITSLGRVRTRLGTYNTVDLNYSILVLLPLYKQNTLREYSATYMLLKIEIMSLGHV